MSNSSFKISPSLAVNDLNNSVTTPLNQIPPYYYNANYFPNTNKNLEGGVFWNSMIENTRKAKNIKLFIFEMKPYGYLSAIWYKELLNASNDSNKNVTIIFAPKCNLCFDKSCRKNWNQNKCENCGNKGNTDYDLLEDLKNAGATVLPFYTQSILNKDENTQICTPYNNYTQKYGVKSKEKICETNTDLHVKLYIYDDTFYVGSANTDEAVAHEMGIWLTDINLANQYTKFFKLCTDLINHFTDTGENITGFFKTFGDIQIPDDITGINELYYQNTKIPEKYHCDFSKTTPYKVNLVNNTENSIDKGAISNCEIYLTLSPMMLCSPGWQWDLLGWLDVISSADKIIYISMLIIILLLLY